MPDNRVDEGLNISGIPSLKRAQNFLPTEFSGFLLGLKRVFVGPARKRLTTNYRKVDTTFIMTRDMVIIYPT